MGRLFPVDRATLIAAVLVSTFLLGVAGGAVTDAGEVTGVIFAAGFFLVAPMVFLFGDSVAIVKDREKSLWREMGQEFSKGRHLIDDESADPVAELRERYARGEIGEAEFERRVERLLETEDLERRVSDRERERSLEPE